MELVEISSLVPASPIPANNAFRALVTLLWPFSSATGQCALLLADRDFRKRYHRGQVRVRFAGPSARAIGASRIGIGDEVEVGLEGASWVSEAEGVLVKVPGNGLEGELVFTGRLSLVVRREGQEHRVVRVDELAKELGSEEERAVLPSTPVSRPSRRSGFGIDDFGVAVYSSPAFMSRLRRLEASNGKTPRTPASGEDGLDDEAARKRRRISYKNVTEWRYDNREPSPDKQAAQSQAVESTGEKEQEDAEMAEVQEGSTEEAEVLNPASKDQEPTLVEEVSTMQDTASSNEERQSQDVQTPAVEGESVLDQDKELSQAPRHPSATEDVEKHAAEIQPSQISEQSKDAETEVSGQNLQEKASATSPQVESGIQEERSIEDVANKLVQEPVEKPVEEPAEKPVQESVQESAQASPKEPSQGLNGSADKETAERGAPVPDAFELEDDEATATQTPVPKSPSMAPPPLLHLQMPTTPQHIAMERDNAMATPMDGQGPLTPRLEPVGNHNLPLPSPFPTSAKRLVAPSPVKAVEQREAETTSIESDPANAAGPEKSDVSVSEHDKADESVKDDRDEASSPTERHHKESLPSAQSPDSQEVEVIELDESDDEEDGLERIRGVPGSTASPIPQFNGSALDNISVAEVEESGDAASHRSSSEEHMASQIAEDEGRLASEETPTEPRRVIPDTYDGMELVQSSPSRAVEGSQSLEDRAASTEDVEMALEGPPQEESVMSEDDYDEDMLVSLQASDESEQGETPDLDFLEDHHDIDEQDLAALRAYEDDSSSSDEMVHDSDSEGSEESLIDASDDDTGDGEDHNEQEDEKEQEQEQEDDNEGKEDRSSLEEPATAVLPNTWGQEDFEPSHPVSTVEGFASQILANAAIERSKNASGRGGAGYSRPARAMAALPAPIEENAPTDEESAWEARAEGLREIEQDQSALPMPAPRRESSFVHLKEEPAADAPPPSSRSKVAIIELSDSEEGEDDEGEEGEDGGSSDEKVGSVTEADQLKEESDESSSDESREDLLEKLAEASQGDSDDDDSEDAQEEDSMVDVDDESDEDREDVPEDIGKDLSDKQEEDPQDKMEGETEEDTDHRPQEEIQGKDEEMGEGDEALQENLEKPQEQIVDDLGVNQDTNEYPDKVLHEDVDEEMADNQSNTDDVHEQTQNGVNNEPELEKNELLQDMENPKLESEPTPPKEASSSSSHAQPATILEKRKDSTPEPAGHGNFDKSPIMPTREVTEPQDAPASTISCPVCSMENERGTASCIMCSNVLDTNIISNSWQCHSEACQGSQYRNPGDYGRCYVCQTARAQSEDDAVADSALARVGEEPKISADRAATDHALGTLSDALTSGVPDPVDVLSKQQSASQEGDALQHPIAFELPRNGHDDDLAVLSPPNIDMEDRASPEQSFIDGAQFDAEPWDFADKNELVNDDFGAQPTSKYDLIDQDLESNSPLPELHEADYNTEVGPQTLDLPQRPAGSDTDAPVLAPASKSALQDADEAQQLTSSSFMTLSSSPPAPPQPSQLTGPIEEIDLSQVEPDYWAYSQPTRKTQRTEPIPDSVGSPATTLFPGSSRQPSRAPSPLQEEPEVSSDEDTIQVRARAPVFSQDLGFSQLQAHLLHPTNIEEEEWMFSCQGCGLRGRNIDDGTHSIACDRCNVWQHSKCNGVEEKQSESADFEFVCSDCRSKEEEGHLPHELQTNIPSTQNIPSAEKMIQSQNVLPSQTAQNRRAISPSAEDVLPRAHKGSLEPFSIEEADEATVDDDLLADYVQVSPESGGDEDMLDVTSPEGVLMTAPETVLEERQIENDAASAASDVQMGNNLQEQQTDESPAGWVVLPPQEPEDPFKASSVEENKGGSSVLQQPEGTPILDGVGTQKNISPPKQTDNLQPDDDVANRSLAPLQKLQITARPQTESNTSISDAKASPSPEDSSEQKVALKVRSQDNQFSPKRHEVDTASSFNQKAKEQSKRPLLLDQDFLATPIARRDTASRDSIGGRMNAVPAVISAWFTPRRSSGVLTPSRSREQQSGKQTPAKVASAAPAEIASKTSAKIASTVPAKIQPQTSRQRSISPPPITRLASQGTSTSLSYFHPLTAVGKFLNQPCTVDVLAVSTSASTSPEQAKSGRKDFYAILHVIDPSLQEYNDLKQQSTGKKGGDDMRVECFRPWKASLPTTDAGDVVLLRNFVVKSQKHRTYLMTGETSSWCVWRFSASASEEQDSTEEALKPVWAKKRRASSVKEEIKGPPMDIGSEEREKATELRRWWEGLKASEGDMAEKAAAEDEDQEMAT